MNQQPSAARRQLSTRRTVLFRLLAIGLSLSPLLFCEAIFTLMDWGQTTEVDDPYIGFIDVHPLFALDAKREKYEIRVSRQQFFRPQSFPAVKAEGTYRIFCLGGSTVQGRPYAVETSFTTWLRLSLEAADPSRRWEVINCGGVSYASYRLAPIVRETLNYEPDLLIIYTGHNEFLEDRTYRQVKQTPAIIAQSHAVMSRLRTYRVLCNGWTRLRGTSSSSASSRREILGDEVEATLDFRGGLQEYHRDDDWREGTIEHFRYNLRRMIVVAQQAGVPVLLVNPVCNLRDTPPFKVEHSAGLTSQQIARFDDLWEQAKGVQRGDLKEECRLLLQAISIDDRHAGVHYHLGKCYEALNRHEQAEKEFIRAKEEDICPLRILEPMRGVIFSVSRQSGAPLVDMRRRFEAGSQQGISGDDLLIDHVHPTIGGHRLIAEALLEELSRQQIVRPAKGWKLRQEELYRKHWESLDVVYFERGKQRLEGLKRWTQGRALRLKEDE